MRDHDEPNATIEYADGTTEDVEVGVRTVKDDEGRVELIVNTPGEVSDEHLSLYIRDDEGSAYPTKDTSAAQSLARRLGDVSDHEPL